MDVSLSIPEPQFKIVDGLSIRFAEQMRTASETVILTSPFPESLYAFDRIWSDLSLEYSLIAVDLPGFGMSEGRPDVMSPSAMGAFLLRLADAFDLKRFHMMSPDVGTSAALFAAALEPGRFGSVFVGSGACALDLIPIDGNLRRIIDAPSLESFRTTDPNEFVSNSIGTMKNYRPPSVIETDYLVSYARNRLMQAMSYVKNYAVDLPRLPTVLKAVTAPVHVTNGRDDPFVPPANAEWLHAMLPGSELELISGGHFVWEDEAPDYADIAIHWLKRHHL